MGVTKIAGRTGAKPRGGRIIHEQPTHKTPPRATKIRLVTLYSSVQAPTNSPLATCGCDRRLCKCQAAIMRMVHSVVIHEAYKCRANFCWVGCRTRDFRRLFLRRVCLRQCSGREICPKKSSVSGFFCWLLLNMCVFLCFLSTRGCLNEYNTL